MGNQSISCDVTTCRFNHDSSICDLDSIQVSCKRKATSNLTEDTLCASYKKR